MEYTQAEILQTIRMTEMEHLDVRTVTLGISLRDCASDSIERRGRRTFLQATPIEVSQLLDERLFDRVDTVILTSATLAVADGFEYTQRRLGVRAARTELVPSHFDHKKQALLYVPQNLPD